MVISRDIPGLSKMINAQTGQASGLSSSSVPSGENFQNILRNLLSDAQSATPSSSAVSSLNQEQLTLLARALQIQMNSRLYNTIFDNSLKTNSLAEKVIQNYSGHIAKILPEASNNSQLTPKKNPTHAGLDVEKIVQEAANEFDVDANLIRSVIKAESNFNPDAKSPKGAMGLMQLMPETARDLGIKNAYDARENVMGGTRYLKTLLNRYDGQVDLALAAYNWGMGNLEKRPHHMPQETLNYVAKVNSYYKSAQA